jgi:A/G-specific adenine glycosylase
MPRATPASPAPFAAHLLEWFRAHGRHDLPWQRDVDPYRVWVSEIMLQQTQVSTVIPYYERFMRRFPDVAALASAVQDEVLALWSGLGYYARARNLHRAARLVVERLGGELPRSHDQLLELPGIGRSTGAAILALAHGTRLPILDGNVKRVLARYHAITEWPGAPSALRQLWEHAERHTPADEVAAYTQAVMDLGATLCTRVKPRCAQCPVAGDCAAFAAGLQDSLPAPRPKRMRAQRAVTALVIRDASGCVLLERRAEQGVWGGLYSFPELGADDHLEQWCGRRLGAGVAAVRALDPVEHAFTHFDLRLTPIEVDLFGGPSAVMDREHWLWYNAANPLPGGIPAPIGKLLRRLGIAASATRDERKIA